MRPSRERIAPSCRLSSSHHHTAPVAAVWMAAVLLPVGVAGGADPFQSLTFDQAMAKAATEKKPVFIDFFTTWCGPCKSLDETTWKDAKVIAWLNDKTIALHIDAEKEEPLADRFKVDGYPTLLFLKPDGTEIDRLYGYHSSSEFITAGDAILSGRDALTRARDKVDAAGGKDPMVRMEYARVLQRQGRKEEALKEYLWCFDEGNRHSVGFGGVRLSYLLRDISALARDYPPARAALVERRDAAREAVLSGKGGLMVTMDFTSLNESLGASDDSLAVYDKLRKEQPGSEIVQQLRQNLMDELLRQRRYAEIADGMDIKAKIDEQFEMFEPGILAKLLDQKYTQEQRKAMEDGRRHLLVQNVSQYYQVLIGLQRYDEAEAAAQRLLKAAPGPETYNNLAWSGYLTGKPVEANVTQAREAYVLTEGRDVAIIDTLARVLNARGQRDEAVEVIEDAMKRLTSPGEQEVLAECLADLGGPRGTPWARYAVPAGVALVLVLLILLRRSRAAARNNPVGAGSAGHPDAR